MDTNRDNGRESTRSRFGQYTQRSQQNQQQEQYQQRIYGYTYANIDYYDARYHGKILITSFQKTTSKNIIPPSAQIPHISKRAHNPLSDKVQKNKYIQYRHGPGILMLDNNTWIITRWSYNQIIDDKVYVITGDYGLMEIHIKRKNQQNNNAKQKQINNKRNNQQQIQIDQIVYVSTFTTKSQKNKQQQGIMHRYTIIGCKQQPQQQHQQQPKPKKKNPQIWKWATILKKIQNTQKQPQAQTQTQTHKQKYQQYYMQTQIRDISINNQKSQYIQILRNQLIQQQQHKQQQYSRQTYRQQISGLIKKNNQQPHTSNNNNNKQPVIQKIATYSKYNYITQQIKTILTQQNNNDNNKLGFHMVNKKRQDKKINNIIGIPNNQISTHVHLQTIIYTNTDINQSVYIKICAQSIHQQQQYQQQEQSNYNINNMEYKIKQMSIINKYLLLDTGQLLHSIIKTNHNTQPHKFQNLNISRSQLFTLDIMQQNQQQLPNKEDKYYKIYDYSVKQVYYNKYDNNTINIDNIRQYILPNFQIQQRLSNKFNNRYRYHCQLTTLNNNINKNNHTFNSLYKKSIPYLAAKYAPNNQKQKDRNSQQIQCYKMKKQYHISSTNFSPSYHNRLIDMINIILCTLNTVYCQSKILQIQINIQKQRKKLLLNNSSNNINNTNSNKNSNSNVDNIDSIPTNINNNNTNNTSPQISNQVSRQDIKKQINRIKQDNRSRNRKYNNNPYNKYSYTNYPINNNNSTNNKQRNKYHSYHEQSNKYKNRQHFIQSLYQNNNNTDQLEQHQQIQLQQIKKQQNKSKYQQPDTYLLQLTKQYNNIQSQITQLTKNKSPYYEGYRYEDISNNTINPTTSMRTDLSYKNRVQNKSYSKILQ